MIVGLGVDLAGIERVRRVWERHRERFVVRVLHPDEREHVLAAADPAERLAGRWAVKEAAMKALGTGMLNGVAFADICLLPDAAGGRPRLRLSGAALAAAGRLGASTWHASLSHSDGFAVAVVVLEAAL